MLRVAGDESERRARLRKEGESKMRLCRDVVLIVSPIHTLSAL